MKEQMQMLTDGTVIGKVDLAIRRLQAFEPEDGYYVAFSGGKDSQCVYHLCQMAGVKFDAHYSRTSVDPPELIYFTREDDELLIFTLDGTEGWNDKKNDIAEMIDMWIKKHVKAVK